MSQTLHQEVSDIIFSSTEKVWNQSQWCPFPHFRVHMGLISLCCTEISCIQCGLDMFPSSLLFSLLLLDLFYPAPMVTFLYLPFGELFLTLESSMSTSLLPSHACSLLHSIPYPPLHELCCRTRSVFLYIASLCCSFE